MRVNTTASLADGTRLRVRLPHALDRDGLRALHERLGLQAEDIDIARTLRFDPRQVAVACATMLVGGSETIVGYGAIDLGADAPHLLVCDDTHAAGVSETLTEALREHAAGRSAA
jgi:hypothetical protein